MAHELVARNGLRVSGNTFLSTVTLDQTLTSTVLALDPSNNEVHLLSAAAFGNDTFITGGTLTGTGNKNLTLTNNSGGTVTIDDVNIHVDSGFLNGAAGVITYTMNDTTTFNVAVSAVTGVTYNNDFDIALAGYGTLSASPVELPFITGGTLNAGTLTLGINNNLESNIVVTGFGSATDVSVTGGTINSPANGTLRLRKSDASNVDITGISFFTGGDTGASTMFMGDRLIVKGGTGLSTVDNTNKEITVNLDQPYATGGTITNNQVILDLVNGTTVTLGTVDALTAVTYSSAWDVAFAGTGTLGTTPVALPFITAATLNAGSLTLEINDGLESDIVVSGFGTLTGDTFVTGATVDYPEATLTRNDGTTVLIDSEQTIRVTSSGIGTQTLFTVDPLVYGAVHVEYRLQEPVRNAYRSGFFTAVFGKDQETGETNVVEFADWSTVNLGTFSDNVEIEALATGVIRVVPNPAQNMTCIANTRAVKL